MKNFETVNWTSGIAVVEKKEVAPFWRNNLFSRECFVFMEIGSYSER
jgi:hypothetical protein